MDPVSEAILIQVIQQILVTVIQSMTKAGMTPEQQAAFQADLIMKLRLLDIKKPPEG